MEHIGEELPSKLKVGFALSQERIMRTSGRKRVYRSENKERPRIKLNSQNLPKLGVLLRVYALRK